MLTVNPIVDTELLPRPLIFLSLRNASRSEILLQQGRSAEWRPRGICGASQPHRERTMVKEERRCIYAVLCKL